MTTLGSNENNQINPGVTEDNPENSPIETNSRRRRDVGSGSNIQTDAATLNRMRQVLKSVQHAIYDWNIVEDTLQWSGNVHDILPVPDVSLLSTGRGYASFLDSDNLTNRYEAVMNSGRTDEGDGIRYEIQYKVLPNGRNGDRECWIEDSGRWFADLGLEPGDIKNTLLEKELRDWPELFATILQLYGQKSGAVRWGEKTPGHYRFVSTLLDWYPDCHILFVMRDPRAIVASNLRAPFSPSYPWFIARRWTEMLRQYDRYKDDPRVCMLLYEDFVTDPGEVLAKAISNLDLQLARTAAGQGKAGAADHTGKGWRAQHLKAAARPVSAKSIDKWRSQLSAYDIWVTERQVAGRMAEFGYEPVSINGASAGHYLHHALVFPRQRLDLAIRAATYSKAARPGMKGRVLRALGTGLDQLSLLCFKLQAANNKNGTAQKTAIITLGDAHVQASSYLAPTPGSEVLGLFATTLLDLGYDVRLAVGSAVQFFAAQKIIDSFGHTGRLRIIQAPQNGEKQTPRVQIYHKGKPDPVLLEPLLELNALDAKDIARRIDALCTKEKS